MVKKARMKQKFEGEKGFLCSAWENKFCKVMGIMSNGNKGHVQWGVGAAVQKNSEKVKILQGEAKFFKHL